MAIKLNSANGSITLTSEDGSGNVNLTVPRAGLLSAGAQTGITSIYATDLILGEDTQTAIDFGTVNEIDFKVDNAARLTMTSAALYPVTTNQIDLGTAALEFKDAYFDGTVTADAFAGPLTLAGELAGADNTVSRVYLKDYGEVTNAIGGTGGGTQDIDLTLGNCVSATVDTSANTFTFSNPTASDELCGFVLFLTNGGSQTVTWPGTVDWPSATAPTLSSSGVDIIVFQTIDGGTIWHGQIASTLSS